MTPPAKASKATAPNVTKAKPIKPKEVMAKLKENYGLGGTMTNHLEGAIEVVELAADYMRRTAPYATDDIAVLDEAAALLQQLVDSSEEWEP